eukprot:scaffold11736_cov140-Cylindrotheca_fusiformis.AAC.1
MVMGFVLGMVMALVTGFVLALVLCWVKCRWVCKAWGFRGWTNKLLSSRDEGYHNNHNCNCNCNHENCISTDARSLVVSFTSLFRSAVAALRGNRVISVLICHLTNKMHRQVSNVKDIVAEDEKGNTYN